MCHGADVSVSYSSQQTLLVLLEGGQAGAYLQQGGFTLLRTACHQTSVVLNSKAIQSPVTDLRTMRPALTLATNSSMVASTHQHLETQHGVALFKQDVPDVQRAVRLYSKEDGGSDRTPAGIHQAGHLIPDAKQALKSALKMSPLSAWSRIPTWST